MQIVLVRHGETAWSLSGQHTGRSDIPLTSRGERNARRLAARLKGASFEWVLTSPLQRARRTSELAGFGALATIEPDLAEWDYGRYEGRRTVEIRHERPDWDLFRDGCPEGESLEDVGARADRLIARIRECEGDVLLFGHRDILRILAVRWLGLPALVAQRLRLSTASWSAIGFDPALGQPTLDHWNDDRHLADDDVPAAPGRRVWPWRAR